MTYLLPTSPITTEAEALKAARASAIAIIIGVVWGVIGVAITYLSMDAIKAAAVSAAAAQGATGGPDAGAIAAVAVQTTLWMGIGFVIVQVVLAIVQWRSPNKIIAFIFLALIAFGVLSTLASVMMMNSGLMGQAAASTPMWQIVVGILVMIVEAVLHITGVRGIGKLDQLQMDAAR